MIKHDKTGKKILYYFSGYTNETQLPNLNLALYNSPSLTFTEGRRTQELCFSQELTEVATRRAGSTSSKGSTGSTASTAHSTTSYARDGMDPCYTCTRIYPWVWIWYGICSSPLRGWRFELVGRRVELAGARRRKPKQARGIWGRGIQASRARTLLRFRGNATPCLPSGHTGCPQHSHGRTRAPEQADLRYVECPHPDCYPMTSADPVELHRP